jgi:hypothetical protein
VRGELLGRHCVIGPLDFLEEVYTQKAVPYRAATIRCRLARLAVFDKIVF